MKIKNIFKKSEKTVETVKIQKLEKTQLAKVIGGVDITSPTDSLTSSRLTRGTNS